ncbi:hypothetical protein Slin15195_G098860 [Septoria linicola]|uniref:Uncharacterized protein n=1 Tax=Septoria linicola TaxID=215465 RepID=A0A9Q9ENF6_9PEZI|nr:hypothetical protein Slin14017_G061920 [Septoria linicola]USW56567.1 hypothetical protein Slin15195_G098860 [Septoria linicola]
MHILLTGFNQNQCTRQYYLRQQLKVVPSHYSLYNCLLSLGHTVDQRPVVLGEDLSQYDECIVYIAGPRQRVSKHFYAGLWAVSRHPKCVLSFDDWQVNSMWKDVVSIAQGETNELWGKFVLSVNGKTIQEVKLYEKELRDGLDVIMQKRNRMVVSAFQTQHLSEEDEYGPHLLFEQIGYPRERLFVFNPNPFHRNRTWEDPLHEGIENPSWTLSSKEEQSNCRPEKRHRFNFASLVQSKTQKWLKQQSGMERRKRERVAKTSQLPSHIGAWPLDLYGSRAGAQKRLTEDEMVQVITHDWGCLMPKYDHAGSGWWRARPLQCADAGSILIGDDTELAVLYGWNYPFYGHTARDIASMSDEELEDIASVQKELLYYNHPLDPKVQQAEVLKVLMAPK